MKANEIIRDYDLYPRTDIDSVHVRALRDSLEAGETLPPLRVDKRSHRLVDGFHRFRAMVSFLGAEADIPVELREYESDAEMFADALKLNARHGRTFSPFDRSRAISRGVALGLTIEKIAGCLALRVDRALEIKLERAGQSKGGPITLKNTVRHLRGKRLTEKQVAANGRAGGMNAAFYVNQVINLVEGDALDLTNEYVVTRLGVLFRLLTKMELHTLKVS